VQWRRRASRADPCVARAPRLAPGWHSHVLRQLWDLRCPTVEYQWSAAALQWRVGLVYVCCSSYGALAIPTTFRAVEAATQDVSGLLACAL